MQRLMVKNAFYHTFMLVADTISTFVKSSDLATLMSINIFNQTETAIFNEILYYSNYNQIHQPLS